jgi:hypothetical protein
VAAAFDGALAPGEADARGADPGADGASGAGTFADAKSVRPNGLIAAPGCSGGAPLEGRAATGAWT